MRFWGPNIQISGEWIIDSPNQNNDNARANSNAAQFEKETQDMLRTMSINPVAKPVLDAFTNASHAVTIRPLAPGAFRKAHAAPINADRAFETDLGSPSAPGSGSPSTVWLYPGGVTVGGHFYRTDDSLLHESFHALRQVRGRWRAVPLVGWDNREELYAVMVTNIYASRDNRNADMRGSHAATFVPMQLTPDQFRLQFRNEILDFRTSMFDVYSTIAAVQATWNPLAVFEDRFWIR
jgi:hypothetical protein